MAEIKSFKQFKVRLTVGTKLVSLMASLLLGSVVTLAWMSSSSTVDRATTLIREQNLETANNLALQMRESLEAAKDQLFLMGTFLVDPNITQEARNQWAQRFFEQDKQLLAVYLHKLGDDGKPILTASVASAELKNLNDSDAVKTHTALLAEKDFSTLSVLKGKQPEFLNIRLPDGTEGVALALPYVQINQEFTQAITAVFKEQRFGAPFADTELTSRYMIDSHATVRMRTQDLAHLSLRESLTTSPIGKKTNQASSSGAQFQYVNDAVATPEDRPRFAAYKTVGFAGLTVVTERPQKDASVAAQDIRKKSAYFSLIIFFATFLVSYLFSRTLTVPLGNLSHAATQISNGDFSINLKPKGNDEVAHLSSAFNDMAKGLEERERFQNAFHKYHGKEIAKQLMSGEIKLGGERKEITVFFSDVRGFTSLSEQMEPEQVVEMLNEYMTRMVRTIDRYQGNVDKFVGDAIMAIWGAPVADADQHENAIRACLAMREELNLLNQVRIERGQAPLRMGMGLHTGMAIAGNIGSDQKMEYTVIGDTVNVASRIESMTKAYGSDFLVSDSIYQRVKDKFVFEACEAAKVKGKAEALKVHRVLGYVDEQGQPVLIETPYSSYTAEASEKVEKTSAIERPAPALIAPVATASEPELATETSVPKPLHYYVDLHGEPLGPFNRMELLDGLSEGEFTGETLIAPELAGPWKPLAQTPGFQAETSVADAIAIEAMTKAAHAPPPSEVPFDLSSVVLEEKEKTAA